MRILLTDIETAPHTCYVWGLWDQNVAINQIVETGSVLCWAAKWLDSDEILFDSVQRSTHLDMLNRIHALLDEADVVVHFNGIKFDIPTLNKEFVTHGLTPPAPYKQIDLLQVVRKVFRFASNKLDFVAQELDLGKKEEHEGFMLWVKCMQGDAEAWASMEKYNVHDVVLLQRLYERVLPWIAKHPSRSALTDEFSCPKCGSHDYQARGTARTATLTYRRFQCNGCGGWFRSTKSESTRGVERAVNA